MKLDDTSEIKLVIENKSDTDKQIKLFGYSDFKKGLFENDKSVSIKCDSPNIDYLDLLKLLHENGSRFKNKTIKIESKSCDQVCQTLDISFIDSYGQKFNDPVYAETYVSDVRDTYTMAEIKYEMIINDELSIETTIFAKKTLIISFIPIKNKK